MKKTLFIAACLLIAGIMAGCSAPGISEQNASEQTVPGKIIKEPCDRAFLQGLFEQYLDEAPMCLFNQD